MSRLNVLPSYQIVTAGDMSEDIESAVTNIQRLTNIGIQLNFTGASPTGTFSVEVSLDYEQDYLGNVIVEGNWVPLTLTPELEATGSAGVLYVNLPALAAPWIKTTFAPDEGGSVGELNAFICGKSP